MKIAIHHNPGSFSDKWIEYCKLLKVEYKLVNCYKNDIVHQVSDCDAFMWHFQHYNPKDYLFAKQVLYSLSHSGKIVFPDFKTCWHYDDKVGQKYLLEAINAPLANSYVFYDKKEALDWVERASFPKVFKLRNGAGAFNVLLAKTRKDGEQLVRTAFGKGFSQNNVLRRTKEAIVQYKTGNFSLIDVLGEFKRSLLPGGYSKIRGKERGYIYFQDFIADNNFDIRLVVVDRKAFGAKRLVRDNDFRASGSGAGLFEKEEIDLRTVKIALAISERLGLDSVAFDFVFDSANEPLVLEMSYGFPPDAPEPCPGYWDEELNWHEGKFHSQMWMIENIIRRIQNKKSDHQYVLPEL